MEFTTKVAHRRAGCTQFDSAAYAAAQEGKAAHLQCLRYLLDLDHGLVQISVEQLMHCAALSGNVQALELAHEAGGDWAGEPIPDDLAKSGNADALRYALQRADPVSWDSAMDNAIDSCSLECVKALYEKGYDRHRSKSPSRHPALEAVRLGWLEGLKFVVENSGPPAAKLLDCEAVLEAGVEMLKYVSKLGFIFDASTTEAAAQRGDLEALMFAHERGALWGVRTLAAAIRADSLPCLEYAHQHGCPHGVVGGRFLADVACAQSASVLRYVCEHMDPTWAGEVLKCTARYVAIKVERDHTSRHNEQLWQLVLYLGRKLGTDLPEPIAEAVAVRKGRAASLAGVFWKAGKVRGGDGRMTVEGELCQGGEVTKRRKSRHADAEFVSLWEVMARVPEELREVLALEAHLIIP
jgi:hypothetical protein